MDFKSCVFNTYVPAFPFEWLTLKAFLCSTWQPDMWLHAPSIARSKHTCSRSTDRSLNSLTHSYIPTDTHSHMERQPVLRTFWGVSSFSNSLSVTHRHTNKGKKKKNSYTFFLTCGLRLHHLSSINVTFHKAAIDNGWSCFKTHLITDGYITPTDVHVNKWADNMPDTVFLLQQQSCCSW